MKILARIGAVLSFLFCFLGGLWIMAEVKFGKGSEGAIWMGFGFYFIGKAFFVGPMLWLAADKCSSKQDG